MRYSNTSGTMWLKELMLYSIDPVKRYHCPREKGNTKGSLSAILRVDSEDDRQAQSHVNAPLIVLYFGGDRDRDRDRIPPLEETG